MADDENSEGYDHWKSQQGGAEISQGLFSLELLNEEFVQEAIARGMYVI